jgi:maltose O-acetyltransferase
MIFQRRHVEYAGPKGGSPWPTCDPAIFFYSLRWLRAITQGYDEMTIEQLEKILSGILRQFLSTSSAIKLPHVVVFLRRVYWRSRLGRLGHDCCIYPHVVIHSPKSVIIGDHVSIAEFVHIWGYGKVSIGNGVMIASHCRITSQTHNVDIATRRENVVKPVNIGDNVWVGGGATILPGVTIGGNSVIAAGSVVTHNIPANAVAMGAPARVCRSIA